MRIWPEEARVEGETMEEGKRGRVRNDGERKEGKKGRENRETKDRVDEDLQRRSKRGRGEIMEGERSGGGGRRERGKGQAAGYGGS